MKPQYTCEWLPYIFSEFGFVLTETDVNKLEKSTVEYSKLKNIPSQIGRKEPTQRNWEFCIPSGTESISMYNIPI